MNSDTERSVKDILKRGWYEQHQTLGEGGWHELSKHSIEWRKYRLLHELDDYWINDFHATVTARDDNAAIAYFHEAYLLDIDNTSWEIQQVTTTYRTVEENTYDKENE